MVIVDVESTLRTDRGFEKIVDLFGFAVPVKAYAIGFPDCEFEIEIVEERLDPDTEPYILAVTFESDPELELPLNAKITDGISWYKPQVGFKAQRIDDDGFIYYDTVASVRRTKKWTTELIAIASLPVGAVVDGTVINSS